LAGYKAVTEEFAVSLYRRRRKEGQIMKESFLDKAKADLKVIGKTANFATHFTKYKLEIQQKKQAKERLLKQIGQSVFDLYKDHSTFKGDEVLKACEEDFAAYKQLEEDIAGLEELIVQAKANLKGTGAEIPDEHDAEDVTADSKAKSKESSEDSSK
jgi:actin-related protein